MGLCYGYVAWYGVAMMKTTFEGQVRNNIKAHPEWRFGQVLFNSLMDLNPMWAEEIRGTDKDPFYGELPGPSEQPHPRISNFYKWLDARTF